MSFNRITTAAMTGVFLASVATSATAATLECGVIGTRYDSLFIDGNKRVSALTEQFKALPANTAESQRVSVRYSLCEAAGEVMGLLKFLRAISEDCTSKGQNLTELNQVLKEQFDKAGPAYQKMCS